MALTTSEQVAAHATCMTAFTFLSVCHFLLGIVVTNILGLPATDMSTRLGAVSIFIMSVALAALIAGITMISYDEKDFGGGLDHAPGGIAKAHRAIGWIIVTAVVVQIVFVALMDYVCKVSMHTAHRHLGRLTLVMTVGWQLWSGAEVAMGWAGAVPYIVVGGLLVLLGAVLVLFAKPPASSAPPTSGKSIASDTV